MIKLAKFPLLLQWVFSLAPSTHVHSASVLSRVRQGVVWLHRARGSSKESSSSVALQGRGHRTLGWAGWIYGSSGVSSYWIRRGDCELKSRGLVARLGVDMNLRLSCNLGCFYGMLGWGRGGPTGGQWGQLMNMASCSVNHDEGSSWMRCSQRCSINVSYWVMFFVIG